MTRSKVEFTNTQGQKLAGLLELPDQGKPRAIALFAHCFTCGKDIAAASRIARALAKHDIGVLRFDFTGLGNSDGDFANTSFSSNLDDLVAAGEFLEEHYQAPRILVGHSLGGAAVLAVAHRMESVEAIATISAPATAQHVRHLFDDKAGEIQDAGVAEVTLAGREFQVKRQMLADLEQWNTPDHIGNLHKALVIFHSPVDQIVDISEAATIFQAAKHPKSFISLDNADHLLSKPIDADYVAEMLVAWSSRYL
ncbi:alpha/beta hydrolase [Halomonas sp. SH5A2]|uniref:alpha/beta hydrolase family protein n=1 Tax=Halomonas sp. SH5A2 TaxID=2749040 RepID=UPI00163F8638|nr:alpha/beta hydrolase [Halomonas sp. SH5A2]QNI03895.1 alpha/beta hydrolase [Halomonas sp. SH5A2]